jgi:hypothetical protein
MKNILNWKRHKFFFQFFHFNRCQNKHPIHIYIKKLNKYKKYKKKKKKKQFEYISFLGPSRDKNKSTEK